MKKLRTPAAATLLLLVVALNFLLKAEDLIKFFNHHLLLILEWIGFLALSFVLFAKKRNNTTVILLGVITLIEAIPLFKSFSISSLLTFLSYGLLVIYALSAFEQTIIKKDLSNINKAISKLHYLPAVLFAIAFIIIFIPSATATIKSIKNEYYFLNNITLYILIALLPSLVLNLLKCFAVLSIGKWINCPYKTTIVPENASNDDSFDAEEYSEAYCGLGKHIVLYLFTFGIWHLIWTYRTTKYLNRAPNTIQYNPTSKLLLCMFVPFYQIYWFYKHGQRIDSFSKLKKLNNSDMATMCLVLGIFIPIVACILMQDRINLLCTTKAVIDEQKTDTSATAQLTEFKQLLDNGIISQEEFDAKKKQLLNL